jgi:hypothetical protein
MTRSRTACFPSKPSIRAIQIYRKTFKSYNIKKKFPSYGGFCWLSKGWEGTSDERRNDKRRNAVRPTF